MRFKSKIEIKRILELKHNELACVRMRFAKGSDAYSNALNLF